MLKAENVTKTYNAGKKPALEDFSLDVPEASIYGMEDESGLNGSDEEDLYSELYQ